MNQSTRKRIFLSISKVLCSYDCFPCYSNCANLRVKSLDSSRRSVPIFVPFLSHFMFLSLSLSFSLPSNWYENSQKEEWRELLELKALPRLLITRPALLANSVARCEPAPRKLTNVLGRLSLPFHGNFRRAAQNDQFSLLFWEIRGNLRRTSQSFFSEEKSTMFDIVIKFSI